MSKQVIFGTHSGRFHADEALAIALLRRHPQLRANYSPKVLRSRDPQVWAQCDVLVDVGGEYDPARCRYDHHQGTFKDTFSADHKTPLSSAGIVYKHYGQDLIHDLLPAEYKETLASKLFVKLYEKFIEPFDAIDCGVERYEAGAVPKYAKPFDIFDMVSNLNPEWNETGIDVDARFEEAVALVGGAWDSTVGYYTHSWLAARQVVVESIKESMANQEIPERTLLLKQQCPWKEHLFELEEELSMNGHFLYALYTDDAGSWRIQAVPAALESFESRKPLPEQWRGFRDTELDALIGGQNAVFVHKTGFIGGHRERDGIIKMAKLAVEH